MPINQRFKQFLHAEKINQKMFCESTSMSDRTISNIVSGRTNFPKADFFQAIAIHYPTVNLRWLLLGEGNMHLQAEETQPLSTKEDSETEKLISLVGQKEYALSKKQEDLNEAFKILMQVAELLESHPAMKAASDQWLPLREKLDKEIEKYNK